MQLTTKGHYAVTAMLDLSLNYGKKPVKLDSISKRQNLPLSYLEQLFSKLKKAALVTSVRGPGGGYMLNKLAQDVSLAQIIDAVEENISFNRCNGKLNCNKGTQCISHKLWHEAGKQLRLFLTNKNLQQILDDCKLKNTAAVNSIGIIN